ncbi:MAG: hypothetical protein JWR23_1951 [Mucilaginibacter sp.]|nr:hypothetical protein [Mucilaginibacter sp.]
MPKIKYTIKLIVATTLRIEATRLYGKLKN